MPRRVVFVLAAVGLVLAGFALAHAQNAFKGEKVVLAEPDTSAPGWKPISDDLGVWVSESETFGLQARLYVRIEGRWVPVAVDGTRELHGIMPVRR